MPRKKNSEYYGFNDQLVLFRYFLDLFGKETLFDLAGKLNDADYEGLDENQNTYKILQLFLNTLYVLSETDKNMDLTISIFKLKLMCFLGFTPIIDKCANCKKNEGIELNHFSFKDNGFKCETCSRQDKGAIEISEATVNAIKYIIMAPPKKLFSFNLSEQGIKELEIIAKIYLNEKLDKEYKLEKLF